MFLISTIDFWNTEYTIRLTNISDFQIFRFTAFSASEAIYLHILVQAHIPVQFAFVFRAGFWIQIEYNLI